MTATPTGYSSTFYYDFRSNYYALCSAIRPIFTEHLGPVIVMTNPHSK